jgi:hypothetical protein
MATLVLVSDDEVNRRSWSHLGKRAGVTVMAIDGDADVPESLDTRRGCGPYASRMLSRPLPMMAVLWCYEIGYRSAGSGEIVMRPRMPRSQYSISDYEVR